MWLSVAFNTAERILLAADNRVSIIMGEQGRPYAVQASYDFPDGRRPTARTSHPNDERS